MLRYVSWALDSLRKNHWDSSQDLGLGSTLYDCTGAHKIKEDFNEHWGAMLVSKGKGSLETTNKRNARNSNDFDRNSPSGHRRRVAVIQDSLAPSSITLLSSTFLPPVQPTRFSTGNNPFSNFFLGGAFYPGKDKKRRHLKKKTLWYRLFCSSKWKRMLSLMLLTYFLFFTVIGPLLTVVVDYGTFLASSRRRKGLHGTWLLYDESLLPSIRTVEEERADAIHLSNEQKRFQSGESKRRSALERIVPGWYHRNDENADRNTVVEEKLKEAEQIIKHREEANAKELQAHSEAKDNHDLQKLGSDSSRQNGPEAEVKPDGTANQALQAAAEKQRRLANASLEYNLRTRTIHNMAGFQNQSSCLPSLGRSDIHVTLVLQSTTDRLWILKRTCERWKDPIILVVFLASPNDEAMAIQVQQGCPQLKIIRHFMGASIGEDEREKYPVNRLRNIGLDAVKTSHILIADVDFVPSNGLPELIRRTLSTRNEWRARLNNTLISPPLENKEAIVVPAFERIPPSELCTGTDCVSESHEELMALSIPESFDELKSCILEHRECRVFQSHNNFDGHSSTRSKAWLEGKWYEDDARERISEHPRNDEMTKSIGSDPSSAESTNSARIKTLPCFDSVRYEPYVVLRWCPSSSAGDSREFWPVAPYYDERFHGYGKNKISMISHLRIMGYTFLILPEGFIIHAPHSISKAKTAWESTRTSSLHKNMDELYPKFLKELLVKYQHENRRVIKQC